ncbi:MAG TPA: EthD family reductase [Vicinamibacterales bacterium]|nr:EthD family reductase [Vicinamibacterales bacterium]
MVKISILYPHTPDATFDMEYYLRTHMPMSLARLRTHPGFIALSVERGVATPQSGLPPVHVAMCHYTFTTAEDFVAAFMPHAALLEADIANYTTIPPVVQFSVVEIAETR